MAVKFRGRRILRVADAVGVKHHNIARVENVAFLIVNSLFKHAKRKTFQRDSFAAAVVIQKRLLLAGVCDAQLVPPAVPGCKTQGHETAFDTAVPEKSVDGGKHFCRTMLLRSNAAQSANRDSAVERGSTSLPADVSHGNGQFLRTVTQKIVEVAAKFPRRDHARGDIEAEFRPGQTRQQRTLNAPRGAQIAFHARFVSRYLFVETRILNRDSEMRGENRKRLHVIGSEIVELRTFQIHYSDDAA